MSKPHVAEDRRFVGAYNQPEPLTISIAQAAELTGESEWRVKQKLREGTYQAKKSGRRTLISYASVKAGIAALPDAKFAAARRMRKSEARDPS